MKIWLDINNDPPSGDYIPVQSVEEAGLWVVLCEGLRDTARAYNDIKGVKKWKLEEISVPRNNEIAANMGAWLIESNRFCPICIH